jgi:exosortase A-associated hydrolase 1
MRSVIAYDCVGETCMATLDDARGTAGLLIVSGGNEIRVGAHRGMAKLAADIAAAGYPVFRFDRRGIGDSAGENGEFTSSAQDLATALTSFRAQCPQMERVIAFGNCDAASALLLHPPEGLAGLVLGNIWVIETVDEMPPPAAIKARYLERMKDPKAWIGLFTGAINLKKLAGGLVRIAKPATVSTLADSVANGIENCKIPATILLAKQDATALAFAEVWNKSGFDKARKNPLIKLIEMDSASHSFAAQADYTILKTTLLDLLSG